MGERDRCLIRWDRRGDLARLTLRGVTNHELREVLIGLFARLNDDDRREHLAELAHYAEMLADPARYPERFLSPVARAIADGPAGESAINLLLYQRPREGER